MAPDPAGPARSDAAERERLARASVLILGDAVLRRRVEGRLDERPDGTATAREGDPARGLLRLGPEHSRPGAGAGLVDALGALGVACAFICVLGDDLAGAELTALVGRQRNVEPWLLADASRATVTETIYHDGPSPLLRTVREDMRPISPSLRARMIRIAVETMALTRLVALADRGHGTLDIETTTALVAGARAAARRLIADVGPDLSLAHRYGGADALLAAAAPGAPLGDAAHALRDEAEVRAAVLLGGDGTIAVADKDGVELTAPGRDGTATASDGAVGEAAYLRRVALFAAAFAIGHTARSAGRVAARLADGE